MTHESLADERAVTVRYLRERHTDILKRVEKYTTPGHGAPGFVQQLQADLRGIEATMKAILCESSAVAFQATHQHAEGGMYQLLDSNLDVHTGKDTWMPAVRYRNAEGREFVRTWEQWRERFTPLPKETQ